MRDDAERDYTSQDEYKLRKRLEAQRAARQLPPTHGVCARCGQPIMRGESYSVSGSDKTHLRDCARWTFETGQRYGSHLLLDSAEAVE